MIEVSKWKVFFMKNIITYFLFLSIFGSMPFVGAMIPAADRELMEIDEPVDNAPYEVKSLQDMCADSLAPRLVEIFQCTNVLAAVAEGPREKLKKMCMFGSDQENPQRNESIRWLISQCPIERSIIPNNSEMRFARPVHACKNMRIVMDGGPVVRVKKIDSEEEIVSFNHNDIDIACAQFAPSGNQMVMVSEEKEVAIVHTDDWSTISLTELNHTMSPEFFLLTLDSSSLIAGGAKGLNPLKIYDVVTGNKLCDLMEKSWDHMRDVKISEDGNKVYVFYEDEEVLSFDGMMVRNRPKPVEFIDISSINSMLRLLPELTLEQILLIELLHKIYKKEHGVDALNAQHVKNEYNALPKQIKAIIEKIMPKVHSAIGQTKRRKSDDTMSISSHESQ